MKDVGHDSRAMTDGEGAGIPRVLVGGAFYLTFHATPCTMARCAVSLCVRGDWLYVESQLSLSRS